MNKVWEMQTIETLLARAKEDMCHLASLSWLKKNKGYTPIFATADRKLYEQKDIVYDKIGVIVEDPLYAIRTYCSTSRARK
jgi:hypothetical protein